MSRLKISTNTRSKPGLAVSFITVNWGFDVDEGLNLLIILDYELRANVHICINEALINVDFVTNAWPKANSVKLKPFEVMLSSFDSVYKRLTLIFEADSSLNSHFFDWAVWISSLPFDWISFLFANVRNTTLSHANRFVYATMFKDLWLN